MNEFISFEKRNELAYKFKSEVISELIETDHINFYNNELILCSCNHHYPNSSYYYKGINEFIHYTSAETALNILKFKNLRLYSLLGQSDLTEFEYASQILKIEESEIIQAKPLLFILCLCEPSSLSKITMFREYGDRTKGIAIRLRIKNDPLKWSSFHLSNVYYKMDPRFEKYQLAKVKFENKYKQKFNLKLNRFLGFYKSPAFSDEKEIRLLYYCTQEGLIPNPKNRIFKDDNNREFVSIPINKDVTEENESIQYAYGMSPIFEVTEIIKGPNFENPEVLKELLAINPNMKISESELKGLYKENS